MLHNKELNPVLKREVETLFEQLNRVLPTPPNMDLEVFRHSLSWFKKDSINFDSCITNINTAAKILMILGYEILLLEAEKLENVLYEDQDQVVVQTGAHHFSVSPIPTNHPLIF